MCGKWIFFYQFDQAFYGDVAGLNTWDIKSRWHAWNLIRNIWDRGEHLVLSDNTSDAVFFLNYYSRFIKDFANVLYELRKAEFYEINRVSIARKTTSAVGPGVTHEGDAGDDRDPYTKPEIDLDRCPIEGTDGDPDVEIDGLKH